MGRARDARERQDVPDAHRVPEDQGGQRQGRAHLHALRDEQHRPPVAPVGDHAAEEREEQDRQFAEERVEPEVERRIRQREDEPALRDFLHPRADAGRERADPQHAEVAVGEGAGHAPEHGVDGHALTILCRDWRSQGTSGPVRES
jgi:hypothetical protein